MVHPHKIMVIGRGSALEHEICNLGRALGHFMISVSEAGRPVSQEPWVAGIAWVRSGADELAQVVEREVSDCFAVIVCDHAAGQDLQNDHTAVRQVARSAAGLVAQVAAAAERAGVSKFVWVRTAEPGTDRGDRMSESDLDDEHYYKEAEDDLLACSFRATVFRPTVIFGQGIAMQLQNDSFMTALPLECVAMAALRASLEPETCGIMERDAIEWYGDAMMIQ